MRVDDFIRQVVTNLVHLGGGEGFLAEEVVDGALAALGIVVSLFLEIMVTFFVHILYNVY